MTQIKKGTPPKGKGLSKSDPGNLIRKLVETAFADKGVWYSMEQPPDVVYSSIPSTLRSAVTRLTAHVSTKDGRVWIRFYDTEKERG